MVGGTPLKFTTARRHSLVGHFGEAKSTLLAAERLFSDEIRCRTIATTSSINKWVYRLADTLALALLTEAMRFDLPLGSGAGSHQRQSSASGIWQQSGAGFRTTSRSPSVSFRHIR
jgi:hypothetical protein